MEDCIRFSGGRGPAGGAGELCGEEDEEDREEDEEDMDSSWLYVL